MKINIIGVQSGYKKHRFSWLCVGCIYYKIKEKMTGISQDLDKLDVLQKGDEQ